MKQRLYIEPVIRPIAGGQPGGVLPQGQPERTQRALEMVAAMEREAFGACTNYRSCEAVCPKEISIQNIARMRREFVKAAFK